MSYQSNYAILPPLINLALVFLYLDIVCPDLPEPTNGVIIFRYPALATSLIFETQAFHSCDNGYYLQGSDIRNCISDRATSIGVWERNEPSCLGTYLSISQVTYVYSILFQISLVHAWLYLLTGSYVMHLTPPLLLTTKLLPPTVVMMALDCLVETDWEIVSAPAQVLENGMELLQLVKVCNKQLLALQIIQIIVLFRRCVHRFACSW